MTDTEILERIRAIFKENFDIDPERVTPEAHLFEELDLDSIDAVSYTHLTLPTIYSV